MMPEWIVQAHFSFSSIPTFIYVCIRVEFHVPKQITMADIHPLKVQQETGDLKLSCRLTVCPIFFPISQYI